MQPPEKKPRYWRLLWFAFPTSVCLFSYPSCRQDFDFMASDFGIGPRYYFEQERGKLQIIQGGNVKRYVVDITTNPTPIQFSASGAELSVKLRIDWGNKAILHPTYAYPSPIWSGKHQTLFFLNKASPAHGTCLSQWTTDGGFKSLTKQYEYLSALSLSLDGDHICGLASGPTTTSKGKIFDYSIKSKQMTFYERSQDSIHSIHRLSDQRFLAFDFYGIVLTHNKIERLNLGNYVLRDAICFNGSLWVIREENAIEEDHRINGFKLDLARLNPQTFEVEEAISLSDKFQ